MCFYKSVDYVLDDALKTLPYYFLCVKDLPDIRMVSCPMQDIEFRILSADLKVNGIMVKLNYLLIV